MTELKYRTWNGLKWEYSYVRIGQMQITYPNSNFPEIYLFTGIYDKHGKEIYAGDILRLRKRYKGKNFNGSKYKTVKWVTGINKNGWNVCTPVWEVVGNIYENPLRGYPQNIHKIGIKKD